MKILTRIGIGLLAALSLFAIHEGVNAFVALHNWPRLTIADWGTWVGGVGTVFTLGITIWLATEAERQRHRDELDLAIIAAAKFVLQVPRTQTALRAAIREIPKARSGSFGPVYIDCANMISRAEIWTGEELKPLVRVPGNIAAKLAFISVRLKTCVAALHEASEKEGLAMRDVITMEPILLRQLQSALDELNAPGAALMEFLVENGLDEI